MKNITNTLKALVAISIFLSFPSISYSQSSLIQWQKSLGGSGSEIGRSVATTNDGGYIMAGYSNSNDGNISGNHGGYDYWVVKTDATGNIQWQRSYGGSGDDYATAIIKANDGGYVIAGYSASNNGNVTGNHGNDDYWIIKTDLSGNIQWQKSLGGSGWDWGRAVIPANGGGYLVTGAATSNNGDVTGQHGNGDIWVIKLDNNGNLQWQKCLGGSMEEDGWSVVASNDGGYIFAGYSTSSDGDVTTNQGIYDFWIVKTDANANIQWQKSLGGSGYDFAYSVVNAINGGYIIAGGVQSSDGDVTGNHGSGDGWILQLDNNGNLLWKKAIGGGADDGIYSIVKADNSGYIFAVHTASNDGDVSGNHGSTDYWLVKTDLSGNILWQKPMGGTSEDAPYSIIKAQDDGYVVAGHSASSNGDVTGNHGGSDYWLVHFNPPGICATCPSVTGLSGTGFRTTVRLQWTDYTSFIPVGYHIYRSTVSNSFGTPVRTIGVYNDYTDYGLSANTTYFYKITAFDVAGNESPMSQQLTVATNNNNYLKVANLDLLIPIYKGDMDPDDPEHIRISPEFARKFYFRNTKGQLNLKYHFMEIDGLTPYNSNGFGDFETIGADLINRGIQNNQYDAIHIEAINTYGYYGGAGWFGQTAGSMGFYPGYTFDAANPYIGGNAWLFTHEFGHSLDLIIANGSGFPEMIFNHPMTEPLPPGLNHFDTGRDFDIMRLILRYFEHHLNYAAPWDGYIEVQDLDNDGLADHDNRLPEDELSFNSSPFTDDSDTDGLTDKQEFIAGMYSGSNPNNPDTDNDGTPDATDIYPISNFSRYLEKTNTAVTINGIMGASEGWKPLVSNPYFSKIPGTTFDAFSTWDDTYLYFTFQSNAALKYYLNMDGSGEDGVFASPIRFTQGNYDGINAESYGDSYYETAVIIIRSDDNQVYLKNLPIAGSQVVTTYSGGIFTTEFRIPQHLGPGWGNTTTPANAPLVTTTSFTVNDTIGIDLMAIPLTEATGNQPDDWYFKNIVSMNEVFHYYDIILTSTPAATYCNSISNFPWEDWIKNVTVGTINNNSGKSPYSDFTTISTNLTAGAVIPVSLTTGFSYFTFPEYWKIWIDYNKNGVFEEPGELAFSGIKAPPPNGTSAATLTGMLNIPVSAATGVTRMRVSMKRNAYATPCETLPFGEVEDYTVHIQAGNTYLADLSLIADADPNDENEDHFYLTLYNNGPSNATNITVNVGHIPHFWQFTGSNTSAINNGGLSGGSLNYTTKTWTIPSLLSGGTAMLDFSCSLFDFYLTPELAFFEIMTSTPGDPDSSPGNDGGAFTANEDDEAGVTIFPPARADLIIQAPGNPTTAQAGSTVSFVFNLKNIGPYPTFAPFNYKLGVFLSGNNSWSSDDQLLQSFNGPYISPNQVIPFNASFTLPTGTPAGNYYLIIVADYEDTYHEQLEDNNSVATTLQVTSSGGPVTYCNSYSDFPWHEWIAKVELGTINNPSGKSAYSNFTNLSTSVNAGQSYPVKLTTGISYFTFDEYWRVWIDYNKNGVFETNEIAFSGILNAPPNGTPTALINGTIQIPANAPAGSTRMRISMKRGAYATPCEVLPFGEVEDYTINIQGGSTGSADLALTAYANPNIVSSGAYHLYVTLTNQGPSTATNITVRHYVHPHFWYYPGWSTSAINNGGLSGGTFNTTTQVWTIPSLAAGATAVLDLEEFIVDSDFFVETDFFEVMTATPGDPDSAPGNDSGDRTPNEDDEVSINIYPSGAVDFIILAPANPASAEAGSPVNFNFSIKNIGPYPPFAPYSYKVGIFLSDNNTWNTGDLLLQSIPGPSGSGVNPGSSTLLNASFTLPAGTAPGSYYLIIVADYENTLYEQNENNNATSTPLQVTGGGSTNYCNSTSNFPWEDWISRVKVNTLDNTSGKSTYSNFTALSMTLQKGVAYSTTLTATFSWTTYNEYWKVWVDFNHNNVFEEPGEVVLQTVLNAPAVSGSSANVISNITIPASALLGPTRMRVTMKRGAFASPCETIPFGEIEDYTVNIVQATLTGDPDNREEDLTFEAMPGSTFVDLYGAYYRPDGVISASIEKSVDGEIFQILQEVDGATEDYVQVTDDAPAEGFNYYRMSLNLNNGEVSYSPVRTVSFEFLKDMTVYPNPATTEVFVHLAGTAPEKTSLVVYDAYGRELLTNPVEADLSEYRIDISGLVPGYYVVYIQREGKRWLGKPFIVVR